MTLDLSGLPLIDDHCHGVVGTDLDRPAFELLLTEGFDPAPSGATHLDGPLGLALRRWCPPLLDLEPFAEPDAYLARRAELGVEEVNRRLLRAAGLDALLLDTGYRSDELLGIPEMAAAAGTTVREIVRIEAVIEAVAAGHPAAAAYPNAVEAALRDAAGTASGAVGFKTIVAYRGGFDFDPSPPSDADVIGAAGHWLSSLLGGGSSRVEDPILLRHGIWTAAGIARERAIPLQVHAGFGDPDLRIDRANPVLLTDLVKALGRLPVDIVFLHCYPYHREAAYLAAIYPNVYLDLGSALNHAGPSTRSLLAQGMEITPFSKHFFSSDAFGLAELYLLGAASFRRALAQVLQAWIDDDQCTTEEAGSIAAMLGQGNATRVYGLGSAGAGRLST